jgi:hypothetical protein
LSRYGYETLRIVPKETQKQAILKMLEQNDDCLISSLFQCIESNSKEFSKEVDPTETHFKEFKMDRKFNEVMNEFMFSEKSSEPPKKKKKK